MKTLDIRNVSFAYSRNGQQVLQDISFSAGDGELIAVLGPNGVGKSTLFKCILGFLKKYQGRILINGRDLRSLSHKQIARQIAYIPQSAYPVFNYDVLDVVMMGLTSRLSLLSSPSQEHIKEAREALASLGIAHLEHAGYGEISCGERQLVLIARALVQKSKILIMDEPTANLDYGNQFRVMQRVAGLAKNGYTILLSTHNPDQAFLYANRVVMLYGGAVLADGTPDAVLDAALIKKVYGVDVSVNPAENTCCTGRRCVPKDTER